MNNFTGQTIGQYQLLELISQGENSVYKGFQPAMNRYVAVKILAATRSGDPAFVQQFYRDMEQMAQMQHPNVLPLLDHGQHNGLLYLVTPFIEGGTLKTQMAQYYAPQRAMQLLKTISGALGYIHQQGAVHGNLKPANILIGVRGEPLLTDFGFTQGIDFGAGEGAYVSPELAQGQMLDRRADTYALGVLLYHMTTGKPPDRNTIPNPRLMRPDLPVEVEKVILKAMAQDPNQRFQTAAEFNSVLKIATGLSFPEDPLPVTFAPAASPQKESANSGNKSLLWILGGLAVIAAFLCVGLLFLTGIFGGGSGKIEVPTPATSTPAVTALKDTNIRTGPGQVYDIIGLLRTGQSAEAVGLNPDQEWWAIAVPGTGSGRGWVAAYLVEAQNTENVSILQPPPTPTPVVGKPQPPEAVIGGPTKAQAGQPVAFTARNSGVAAGSHLIRFVWDFGAGATGNGVDVTHIYNKSDNYRVSLTVIDDKELSDTATHRIKIDPGPKPDDPPVAVINAPSEAKVGEPVTFDAGASQSANSITSYAWDLGDGTTANAVQIEHVYGLPGKYNVRLTVTDKNGLSGSQNHQITIKAQEPEPTEEPGGEIEGINWSLNGTLPAAEIIALFEGGAVFGSSGCNPYSASYQLNGDSITISGLTGGQALCEDDVMQQEARYLNALGAAQTYEVKRGTLRIFGGEMLVYSEQ